MRAITCLLPCALVLSTLCPIPALSALPQDWTDDLPTVAHVAHVVARHMKGLKAPSGDDLELDPEVYAGNLAGALTIVRWAIKLRLQLDGPASSEIEARAEKKIQTYLEAEQHLADTFTRRQGYLKRICKANRRNSSQERVNACRLHYLSSSAWNFSSSFKNRSQIVQSLFCADGQRYLSYFERQRDELAKGPRADRDLLRSLAAAPGPAQSTIPHIRPRAPGSAHCAPGDLDSDHDGICDRWLDDADALIGPFKSAREAATQGEIKACTQANDHCGWSGSADEFGFAILKLAQCTGACYYASPPVKGVAASEIKPEDLSRSIQMGIAWGCRSGGELRFVGAFHSHPHDAARRLFRVASFSGGDYAFFFDVKERSEAGRKDFPVDYGSMELFALRYVESYVTMEKKLCHAYFKPVGSLPPSIVRLNDEILTAIFPQKARLLFARDNKLIDRYGPETEVDCK